jgi:hypothetical protein
LNVIGATVLQGPLTIAAPFSGTVSVPPQTSDVVVQGSFPALPRILLTPEVVIPQADSPLRPEDMWDGSFYLTNVSSSGFTIHLPRGGYCTQYNPCPMELSFHWLATMTDTSFVTSSSQVVTSSSDLVVPPPSAPDVSVSQPTSDVSAPVVVEDTQSTSTIESPVDEVVLPAETVPVEVISNTTEPVAVAESAPVSDVVSTPAPENTDAVSAVTE